MREQGKYAALVALGVAALVAPTFAEQPGAPGPPGPAQPESTPKSDQHRIVGQVLQIDRDQGLVRLATDEGILIVQAPPRALDAIEVGDTVAVPRSALEVPSAAPRP